MRQQSAGLNFSPAGPEHAHLASTLRPLRRGRRRQRVEKAPDQKVREQPGVGRVRQADGFPFQRTAGHHHRVATSSGTGRR